MSKTHSRPIVVFFQRRPRKFGNFSVEFIFDAVRRNLPSDLEGVYHPAKHESIGLWKRLYIMWEAAQSQGDVNHVTGDVHFLTLLLQKRKTVLTVLDVGFMKHPSKWARAFLKFFWITLPVKKAQLITTISQATKQELLKYTSFPAERVKVVYVPISDDFKPIPKPFNKEKPVILQLGVAFNKNIERLIEAIKDIPCHLEIVGKLPEPLLEKLQAYNISHQISWNLSNEEVRQKYAECDILSLISTYEGFGMPIVEANAVGRAVITANILSMPEVAGNAAHLVDPFNIESMKSGFLKIIDDDEYREQLIANGFINRRRFSINKITKEYIKIYKEILNL
ncbi:Glycosyltransferase involved in cell wall bisynthesis [Algoriphagus faecimaris]|uniref:Glycosyltransferase involved in cell wall bisynthesis n=1 Tax=Algoriphagus faecimaris TaxID=686796 RepID=A0A1G6UBU2_9BACT|nr:glycosyltransferase family 1 protein [Algoriphagus faecimaris]SDD38731.1 Glycosyltransferase involved in cell wall bisynthesis [Algoriphagus faecimaris]